MRIVALRSSRPLVFPLLAGLVFSAQQASQAADEAVSGSVSADVPRFVELFNGRDLTGWVDVNTGPDTWSIKDGLLVCSGLPIGVMRSAKQYENFVLHIEPRSCN